MPQNLARKIRSVAAQRVIGDKKINDTTWQCCGNQYNCHEGIGRHVHESHVAEIQQWQDQLWKEREQQDNNGSSKEFRRRRAPKGGSDPIAVNCECPPGTSQVILFYKYIKIDDPAKYAHQHQKIGEQLDLTGKVRIANEGVNITLGGTNQAMEAYLDWITTTDIFATDPFSKEIGTDLKALNDRRYQFFKPSKGCRHVFADLSIKIVDEICPLGRPARVGLDQLSEASDRVQKLEPEEFHDMLLKHRDKEDTLLIDTRNYYESRIGLFQGALTPQIRKFSRFPDYVDRNRQALEGKTIFTYCTGGIRCEKATAYMHQVLSPDTKIHMLKGGIHNYIEWCKRNDSDKPSLWLGKNYVFDARQALALADDDSSPPVSVCQRCGVQWDIYQKCGSTHCHLLVLYCTSCATDKVYCCNDCKSSIRGDDGVCECERKRRAEEMKPLEVH
ncbi:hypothetical protein BJV82DRAFT_614371 [Fennellomyces sp. T-0311]|nr:hypothetical protein BJV82DRAFT_614371 [Fennellomyces sp. T-0311]